MLAASIDLPRMFGAPLYMVCAGRTFHPCPEQGLRCFPRAFPSVQSALNNNQGGVKK
jgi:hypothetical protein